MEPHQPIGDGKTEARPLMAAAEALIHLAERLDEMRQMLLSDADAGVADRDARAFRRGGDRNPDAAFGGREFDPVADDVEQDLAKTPLVAFDDDLTGPVGKIDADAARLRLRAQQPHRGRGE